MLATRIATAIVLAVALGGLLWLRSYALFAAACAVFVAAASWESARLFERRRPALEAALATALFLFLAFASVPAAALMLAALCVAVWLLRLTPALALGLPLLDGAPNALLHAVYGVALVGCFIAVVTLFRHSPLYLVSVLAIVWIADIGAYFCGKAFGKRKLAPSISPGKSWEGALGGWLAVLLAAMLANFFAPFDDTFAVQLRLTWGLPAMIACLTLMVGASVVGDLFESQLKRRAGVKDSGRSLPGHGGVLDRIDALVPVMPLALLVTNWL